MTSLKRIYTTTFLVIGIIILGIVVFTSWYTVDESDQAVVLTFGEAGDPITEPGLKFKAPWPIQTVEKVPKGTFSTEFGYEEVNGELVSVNESDTKMITGDENIVLADMVVQWNITDPGKFLFNVDNPEEMIHNAANAALRSIIGSSGVDEALTDGRAEIEGQVWDLLTTLVDRYDMGVAIRAVQLQDVELPSEEVRSAFTAVTDARETQATKLNEAERYRNQELSEAEGEKEAIISRAEGDKAARLQQARGDVAVFNKLYEQYVNSPDVTRERLIIETLEEVLPNAEIYIMNDNSGTLTYLPLRPLEGNQPKVTEETPTEGSGN